MLDLAKETVWGIYALHYLATRTRAAPLAEIAGHGKVPARRLAPILRKLRVAGLLQGRSGHGYALGRSAGTISVEEVASILTDKGVELTTPTLKSYLQRARHARKRDRKAPGRALPL